MNSPQTPRGVHHTPDVVQRSRARGAIILIVVSTLAAVAAIAVVWSSNRQSEAGDAGSAPGSAVLTQWDPPERERIEAFTAGLLDDGQFDSEAFEGQVSVVNVWGSWCAPCREEAPVLTKVARETRGEVMFLGINVRDSPDAARAFERTFDVRYDSVHPDESAEALLAFRGALASAAVPSTVVLDDQGRMAARVVGAVDETTLLGLIEDAG